MAHSKAEKQAYFAELRARWGSVKKALTQGMIDEVQAVIASHGLKMSVMSYVLVAQQMKALGLDGIPYLDCKTFQGWREAGFIVKKGEHSHISGITWINAGTRDEATGEIVEDSGYLFPKEYHLFHRTQVQEMEA